MSDKNFSVILTVDLSCSRCHDKIKKVLSKHQDRWNIKSVVWDEKHNKITLTGPFCPRKLSKKLCRKACKVIKDIDIPDLCDCDKEKPKPPEPKPDPPKPAPPKPADPKPDPPKPAPPPAKPNPAPAAPAPEQPKPAPPPPAPEPAPQPKPEPDPVVLPEPCPPVWPTWWGGPWCECGAGGGYAPCGRGCRCGGDRSFGQPCHDGGRVEFFCEEDPTCRLM